MKILQMNLLSHKKKELLFFEDIDAMCEILKDRDLINNEQTLKLPSETNEEKKINQKLYYLIWIQKII